MFYFDDFDSKFGFSDGEAVPPDAEEKLKLYVKYINMVANKMESKCLAFAYYRPGVHNPYLIMYVNKANVEEMAKTLDVDLYESLTRGDSDLNGMITEDILRKPDEAMESAIEFCYDLDLDYAVVTTVTLDEGQVARIEEDIEENDFN